MEIFYTGKEVLKCLEGHNVDEFANILFIFHVNKELLLQYVFLCDKDHVWRKNICVSCLKITTIVSSLFLVYGIFFFHPGWYCSLYNIMSNCNNGLTTWIPTEIPYGVQVFPEFLPWWENAIYIANTKKKKEIDINNWSFSWYQR